MAQIFRLLCFAGKQKDRVNNYFVVNEKNLTTVNINEDIMVMS